MIKKLFYAILCVLSLNGFSQTTWDIKGKVCTGRNFDAEILNGKIYLISDEYFEIDTAGNQLFHDPSIKDIGQGVFDFHPAITVNQDSTVFIIRRSAGNKNDGFDLSYDKRSSKGDWTLKGVNIGENTPRNYVVDIVPLDSSRAIAAHTRLIEIGSSIKYYIINQGKDTLLGEFKKYIRGDCDFTMKTDKEKLYVGMGFPGRNNERGFIMSCDIDSIKDIENQLDTDIYEITSGSPRKAFPALTINDKDIGMTFGPYQRVYFTKVSKDSLKEDTQSLLFTHTGEWHLNCGLSSVASSKDGKYYLTVALRAKGNATAENSDLIYTYSADSGKTWSNEIQMGIRTNGNEGRQRPVLLYSDGFFYLLYYDPLSNGISLAKLNTDDIPENLEYSGKPTILPSEGFYEEEVKVEIIPNNPASKIYYTTDGTNPSFTSKLYTAPFLLSDTTLVKAIEYQPHHLPGQVIDSAMFEIAQLTFVNKNKADLKIWPLPAKNSLNISSDIKYNMILVFDMQGRMIYSGLVDTEDIQIDITGFEKGMYVLKLNSKGKDVETVLFMKF